MNLKSLRELPELTIKKWAVHRSDGYMFSYTLSDSRFEAIQKFMTRKMPQSTTVYKMYVWDRLWKNEHKYTVNEMMISYERFTALVNENAENAAL